MTSAAFGIGSRVRLNKIGGQEVTAGFYGGVRPDIPNGAIGTWQATRNGLAEIEFDGRETILVDPKDLSALDAKMETHPERAEYTGAMGRDEPEHRFRTVNRPTIFDKRLSCMTCGNDPATETTCARPGCPYKPSAVEAVDHSKHYGGSNNPYEVTKVLESWLSPDEFAGFLRGNVIKYLARASHKAGDEDLRKAQWYQNYLVEWRKRCAASSK